MKKLQKALTGKKALHTMLGVTIVCTILDIATSIRIGSKIDFGAMGIIYTALTAWALALEKEEKKYATL